MIITCNQCDKKFEIESSLITDNGRLLQCGSCNHKWFFKKNVSSEILKSPLLYEEKIDDIYEEEFEDKVNVSLNSPIKSEKNIIYKEKLSKKNNFIFFKTLSVICITIIAFIVLIDTLKEPISLFIPNIDLIMQDLYETFHDVYLFFKDLI
jgi:predicted Zn finger-like uncharacterized protein